VKSTLRRSLVSGVVVITPIAVTAFVVLWLYRRIAAIPTAEVLRVTGVRYIDDLIQVAVSVAVLIVALVVIGYLVRTAAGVMLKDELDRAASKIPIVRIIYNATKTGVETVVAGTGDFKRPVKIDFDGLRFTAFKTGGKTEGGREVIFLPTAPNITSGFVIEIDPDRFEDADESVEDALTRILSAGFGAGDKDVEELLDEATGDVDRQKLTEEEVDEE